jgi:outer membrane protein assembly factor BamB
LDRGDTRELVRAKLADLDASMDTAETTIAAHTTALATKATYLGPIATVDRPAAAAGNRGAYYLDTTVGKPVWSTGTAWVDGAGTAVP